MTTKTNTTNPHREAMHELTTAATSFKLGLDLLIKPDMKHDRKVICSQMDKNVEIILTNWKLVRKRLSHE